MPKRIAKPAALTQRTASQLASPRKRPASPEPDGAVPADEHEGATEQEVGDRTGPGAGYDDEPVKVKDTGGVK